ncbi:protein-S-isoprenylcysteine O-methyltransferase [Bacillus rossius redtenbacheri]|uniref:protein-S-isoprenylcysteine O-methyltransferase n=1 Tax=Bacillus rossius redtenbacheri TaxID=93214 RepID=UPI002FDDEFEF
MAVNSAKISLYFFLAGSIVFVTLFLPSCGVSLGPYAYLTLLFYYVGLNVAIAVCMHGFAHQVAIRSAFLGFVNSLGIILLCTATSPWNMFGCYVFFLTFFHFSEFLVIALTNPKSACVDSFMLNHSWEYGAAALASWTEFLLEVWLVPNLKRHPYITLFGAVLCFSGEVLRKLAIFTAKSNFSHVVQSVREDGHRLVTHGVYSWCRHPSYVGWFYWSVGTQLVLVNPVCVAAYALLSWKFFYHRVQVEELTLLRFFGRDYHEYQQRVGTGLPFIGGYVLPPDTE